MLMYYNQLARDMLRPLLGPDVDRPTMENVTYQRGLRYWPLETSPMPTIGMWETDEGTMFVFGLCRPLPLNMPDGKTMYVITYASEPVVMCEELHRIAHELGAPWWDVAGHNVERDPMHFDCHAWQEAEWWRLHQ